MDLGLLLMLCLFSHPFAGRLVQSRAAQPSVRERERERERVVLSKTADRPADIALDWLPGAAVNAGGGRMFLGWEELEREGVVKRSSG